MLYISELNASCAKYTPAEQLVAEHYYSLRQFPKTIDTARGMGDAIPLSTEINTRLLHR